jgi:hypothetical protein
MFTLIQVTYETWSLPGREENRFRQRSVILTTVNTKNTVFRDVMPYSLAERYQRFGGTYLCLRVLYRSILYSEDGANRFLRSVCTFIPDDTEDSDVIDSGVRDESAE